MMSPYGEFLIEFERRHADFTHRNHPANDRAAVIVETRPHFFLPKVIRNVMYFLGKGWNLYIITAGATTDFLCRGLPGWRPAISTIPDELLGWNRGLSRESYDQLVTTTSFWDSFGEEKVLTFQTDTLLTRYGIEEFLGFDYIGAPCSPVDDRWVLNGGLALRTRSVMLDCLAGARPEPGELEDAFFTRRVATVGGVLADLEAASRFSVESHLADRPLGVHGTDKFYLPIGAAQWIVAGIVF